MVHGAFFGLERHIHTLAERCNVRMCKTDNTSGNSLVDGPELRAWAKRHLGFCD